MSQSMVTDITPVTHDAVRRATTIPEVLKLFLHLLVDVRDSQAQTQPLQYGKSNEVVFPKPLEVHHSWTSGFKADGISSTDATLLPVPAAHNWTAGGKSGSGDRQLALLVLAEGFERVLDLSEGERLADRDADRVRVDQLPEPRHRSRRGL